MNNMNIRLRVLPALLPLPGSQIELQPQGRLSLLSDSPISDSNIIGATTMYYVPAVGVDVPIYNGTIFQKCSMTEQLVQPLDDNSAHLNYHADYENYDEFVFLLGGVVTLGSGPRWQDGEIGGSDNDRGTGLGSTELELFDSHLVNKNEIVLRYGSESGDIATIPARQATYVGSFTPIGDGLATDGERQRMVFNQFNQTLRSLFVTDSTVSWVYSTSTWRFANGDARNKCEFLLGTAGSVVDASGSSFAVNSTSTRRAVDSGIGLDDVVPSQRSVSGRQWVVSGQPTTIQSRYVGSPGLGRHALTWLEKGAGSDAQTWYGSDPGAYGVGIVGTVVS
jgi:hypothetical protein